MDFTQKDDSYKKCQKCSQEFHDSLRVAKKHLLYRCRDAYPDNLEVHKILRYLQDKNDYIKPVNKRINVKLRNDLY